MLEFDHVRGDKSMEIASMRGFSLERITHEVEKCDIVCANCHRKRTAQRANTMKHKVMEKIRAVSLTG